MSTEHQGYNKGLLCTKQQRFNIADTHQRSTELLIMLLYYKVHRIPARN